METTVVVCGWDRLAIRVVEGLHARGAAVIVALGSHDPSLHGEISASVCDLQLDGAKVQTSDLAAAQFVAERAAEGRHVRAVMLCSDDDVANVREALAIREQSDTHLVVRMFNTRIAAGLPRVLGSVTALSATRIAAGPFVDLALGHAEHREAPRSRVRKMVDLFRGSHAMAVWRQLWRRPLFRWMLVIMGLLVALEVLLVRTTTGIGGLAALHSALGAVLTTGFTDAGVTGPALAESPMWAQVASVGVIIADAAAVAVLFGLVADALIGERFARVYGGSARKMRGHVVVAGLGTTGYRVAKEVVRRGYRCMAIESNPDSPFVAAARRLGVGVVLADVRQEDEFAELGIERAAAFISVTDDDAANLEAGLTSLNIAPDLPVVLRMFDPKLAAHLEAGADSIVACRSVARLAAPTFVAAALDEPHL